MSVSKRPIPIFVLALALVFLGLLAATALSPYLANAQTVRDHRTAPIVRDHRARECRVTFSEHPTHSGFPAVIGFCALPPGDTHPLGSFCTCQKLIEGSFQTVGGKIVLVSEPNG